VQSTADTTPGGTAEAFQYAGAYTGTVNAISAYIDTANAASTITVGLYADNNGHPGALLTSASISNPTASGWATISVPTITLAQGSTYWIAILGNGGQAGFRDSTNGSCGDETSLQNNLTSLPAAWSTGSTYHSCPASLHADGQPQLMGTTTVQSSADNAASGNAEAFQYTATAAGSVSSLTAYIDTPNTASTITLGLYSDNHGHPGTLLTSASTTNPTPGTWASVAVPSAPVITGTKYWVAILGAGGQAAFRDSTTGTCGDETSAQTNLTSLPNSWSTGSTYTSCPASMHAEGPLAPSTYTYDQAGQLINYQGADHANPAGPPISEQYTYDAAGLRQTRTLNNTLTNQVWSQAQGLPLLIEDGPNAYITGPGGLPLEEITQSGTVYYYQYDQQGSTTALTDSSGNTASTSSYDAWGNPTSTPAIQQPLGYDGQYTDPETGLQYLHARYYDPTTGQFTTPDPLASSTRQPYSYAANSPTNSGDPTGLDIRGPGADGNVKVSGSDLLGVTPNLEFTNNDLLHPAPDFGVSQTDAIGPQPNQDLTHNDTNITLPDIPATTGNDCPFRNIGDEISAVGNRLVLNNSGNTDSTPVGSGGATDSTNTTDLKGHPPRVALGPGNTIKPPRDDVGPPVEGRGDPQQVQSYIDRTFETFYNPRKEALDRLADQLNP
jgi:RHS repeat-associated protein